MKINQRKVGVILTYLSEAVKILTGLIYTPIMLRLLGKSEYGLYQLVFSVVSYLGLLSLGFGSSYMRFYSQRKVLNDKDGIAKLNGMFMTIFIFIAIICITVGLIMIANIHLLFGESLIESEYKIARILMIFMVLNLAITFIDTVFSCNLIAHEEFVFQKGLTLLHNILNPFLTIPILLIGFGSVGMVVISTVLTIVSFLVNMCYSLKKLKMQFCFKKFEISLIKDMWIFTFFIFVSQIVDQINWNVDKFLLGRMIGTSAVAVYGVASQINSMYLQFSTSVSNVFIPAVNTLVAKGKMDKELTNLFTKVGRIQFFIMALILSGFIFIGKPFITHWAGKDYVESYLITLFLIIPVTIPLIQNLGIEIQRAKNLHKSRSFVYLFISIINIFISIPLIQQFGPIGAAIGTAIALTLGNIIFMNFYYHHKIKLNMVYFWKNILNIFPSLILPILAGIIITRLFIIKTIIQIGIFIIIYCIIYCFSIYRFGLNSYEKDLVSGIVNKLVKRKKCEVNK